MTNETVGSRADHQHPVRTVPRFALRIVWLLHRAMVRLSGHRFGLSRPEAGERFGMMRLTTLGRRSGATRVAIVGYYEDGANLGDERLGAHGAGVVAEPPGEPRRHG